MPFGKEGTTVNFGALKGHFLWFQILASPKILRQATKNRRVKSMKAKQSLSARIRGWFPEEPNGHKLSFTHSFDAQSLRAQNNYGYSLRQVSLQIDISMIFAIILGSFGLILVLSRLSFAYWIIMVFLGIFVGLFLALVPTNYDLKRLIQGDKTKAKFSQIVYIFFINYYSVSNLLFRLGSYS